MRFIRKNNFVMILVVMCLLLILQAGGLAAEEEVYVIKAGHVEPEGTPLDQGWRVFESYVESASGGRIQVDIYPACQLGGCTELFQAVRSGTIQIGQGDEGAMASFYDPFLLVSIPYLFPSIEVGLGFYESDFFKNNIEKGLIEELGVRFLGGASYGYRNWTNSKRPIKSLEDFKGLNLRVMETPLFIKYVQGLGAGPTPISFAELYSALEQGVVDGQENPTSVILDQYFFEVQKYLTLDEHVLGVNTMFINEEFYQSLPDDLKKIIRIGAKYETYVENGGRLYQNEITALSELEEKGMETYRPTEEELEELKEASQGPIIEWLKELLGEELVEGTFLAVEEIQKEL